MWWILGSVAALIVGAVWYERQKVEAQLKAEGWTPVIPGSAPPLPTAPAGVVPTVTGPDGSPLVTLVPGNMGTLKVTGVSAFPPPSIDVQAPPPGTPGVSGLGWLGGVTSSNPSVVDATHALIYPGKPGQGSTTLIPMNAGTTNISVSWNDGTSAQTTTFTIVAS